MTDPAKPATLADVERLETMRAGDDELMYRFQLSIDAPALFAAVRELERDRQDEEAIYELCWEICNEVRSSSLHIAGSTTTLDPEHVRFEHQANGADECAYKILAAKNAAVRVPLNDTGADDQGSSCEPVHAAPQGQLNESSGRQEQQCAKGMAPVAEPAAPAGPSTWILTSPNGTVLHCSQFDGWQLDILSRENDSRPERTDTSGTSTQSQEPGCFAREPETYRQAPDGSVRSVKDRTRELRVLAQSYELLQDNFDQLAAAVGYTPERAAQTGDSPLDCAQALRRELEELRKDYARTCSERAAWVNDLQSDMYVNCVYCGHRYGP